MEISVVLDGNIHKREECKQNIPEAYVAFVFPGET